MARAVPGTGARTAMRWQLILSLTVLALLIFTAAAFAHSKKKTSEPADGAVLTAPPEVIRMGFDMPITITMFAVTDAAGGQMAVERMDGQQQVTTFEAVPAAMGPGNYSVEWRGLSADGHPVQGGFTFEVK
ncbi:MAG: copper resistance protein CopC [Pseudomonadota bacterium]